jgi:hypothetical protein
VTGVASGVLIAAFVIMAACDLEAVTVLVPHLAGLAVERLSAAGRSVHVLARTCVGEAPCTGCGVVSPQVHSRYRRQLADTASGGQEVLIYLQARRFFCKNQACAKATFAEQVPGLTTRYGRRTCGLQAVLQAVALALGGRAGARLTGRLSCTVSRSTLIRLIRAAADPDEATPLVLGVDLSRSRDYPDCCAAGSWRPWWRPWWRPGRRRLESAPDRDNSACHGVGRP